MRERRAEILKVHNADMKWFKFYGQDFQTDPKIGYLTTPQKLMWVNLLCIASQDENHSGIIKFLTESHLRSVSGILDSPSNDDWDQSQNTFETFEKLGLIERPDEDTIIIPKFKEKQETQLTDAERAKKYRENKKNEANSDIRHEIVTQPSQERHVRIDKNRIYINTIAPKKSERSLLKENQPYKEQEDFEEKRKLQLKKLKGFTKEESEILSTPADISLRDKIKNAPRLVLILIAFLVFSLPVHAKTVEVVYSVSSPHLTRPSIKLVDQKKIQPTSKPILLKANQPAGAVSSFPKLLTEKGAQNREFVLNHVKNYYSEGELMAFDNLMKAEAGYVPKMNGSGCGGFPQACPFEKMGCAMDDLQCQAQWVVGYINRRYEGSPIKAWNFWLSKVPIDGEDVGNWY